jgi:hypothetical protein
MHFMTDARAGLVRYSDRAVAIADGYHLVGPELPAMGEHWLNIALILADSLDAAHPPVLIYVSSPKGPVLAGAAYTRLLGAGAAYPDFPRGLHAWHDHSGLVEDEALPMAHASHSSSQSSAQMRLGIMHLWTGVENPAGPWTADNWALPFIRAGVRPVQSDDAARALALVADSGHYYLEVLTMVGRLDSTAASYRISPMFYSAARAVAAVTTRAHMQLSEADVAELEQLWRTLGEQLRDRSSPDERARLRPLFVAWWHLAEP